MSYAPWSISKADVALACNLRFHLKYDRGEKGQAITSGAGRLGSAAHVMLERMLEGQPFERAFKAGVMKAALTHKEIYELKTYREPSERFLKKYRAWKEKYDVQEEHIEMQVAVNEDLEITDYWAKDTYFRGVFDLGTLVKRGGDTYLIIIDHKSGDPKPLEDYANQLHAYLVCALSLYPDIAGAQAAIHWLRAQEDLDQKVIEWTKMYSADAIRNELVPWFRSYLAQAQDRGDANPEPNEGWYCTFCEYQYKCPKKGA